MYKYSGRQRTRFDEERARLILRQLFPERYSDSELSESPDIVCKHNSIGIEVTSCRKPDHREKDSIVGTITGKRMNELTEKEKDMILRKDVIAGPLPNGIMIAGYAMWGDEYDIVPILNKKLKKLKNRYKTFGVNELFVFAWMLDDIELEKMISDIYLLNFKDENSFDAIYICRDIGSNANVEILKLSRSERASFVIDRQTMLQISTKAKAYIVCGMFQNKDEAQ